jgi:hypothetical protein
VFVIATFFEAHAVLPLYENRLNVSPAVSGRVVAAPIQIKVSVKSFTGVVPAVGEGFCRRERYR